MDMYKVCLCKLNDKQAVLDRCKNILYFSILSMIFVLRSTNGAFECAAGLWGSTCTHTCGKCEGGPEFCQVTDGLCVNGCGRGYKGKTCKTTCEPGTHGQYCLSKCGQCSDVRPNCNPVSGKCLAGCKPGYQWPYCKIPCQYNTWGANCNATCSCKGPPHECGCHHLTGACTKCGIDGRPEVAYVSVNKPQCLNQHAINTANKLYTPPSVLNIPWMPVVVVSGLLALFIFTNFLWWIIYVRKPRRSEKKQEKVREKRRQRPLKRLLELYELHARKDMEKYRLNQKKQAQSAKK